MRPLALVALFALISGCGKKAPPEASAEVDPSQALTAEMPDTKEARSFAEKLVETEITDWQPISGDGAEFTYDSLTFSPDGSWSADAKVAASFEEFTCQESGTWVIDEAESDSTATMDWTLGSTTCPMREKGSSLRVKMTISKGGDYKIMFR